MSSKNKRTRKPNKEQSKPFIPFNRFLEGLICSKQLSPDLLKECVGLDTANLVLDNANNQMGKPALGTTGIALHGQLHEFTGAIDDVKSSLANRWERIQNALEKDTNQLKPPKDIKFETPTTGAWPPKLKP